MAGKRLTPSEFFKITKALSDPRRCEILERIAKGEACCAKLCERLPVSQATVSHHLKELLNAQLLEVRREGQFSFYRFCPEIMASYSNELARRFAGG